MQVIRYDIGYRNRGELVEITLSSIANVRLMDYPNLGSYENGRQYYYYGGLANRSQVRLQIPGSGHWYVIVDMKGLDGSVLSSVHVLPGPLP